MTVGGAGAARAAGWLRAHPLLSVGAASAAFSAVWFVVQAAGPVAPPAWNWLTSPISTVVTLFACARQARNPDLDPAVRRFWRHFATAFAMMLAALAFHARDALTGPDAPSQRVGPLATALYLGGVCTVLWAFIRLPAARPGRRPWLTFSLDAGVVMIAASLGAWCFAYSSARLITQTAWYLPTLGVIALGFTGLLALTKLALSGTSPLGPRVLWALGGAIMTGALGGALTPLLVSRPDLTDNQFSVPLTSLGVVVAAHLQGTVWGRQPVRHHVRRLGPFSLMPYLSVASVDVLLLGTTLHSSPTARAVVVGSVLLTGLVVTRQLLAFRENARLLSEVDAAQQRFRSLIQNSSDIITILDPDGVAGYVSPGLRHTLGYDPQLWVGDRIARHVHPDDRPALFEQYGRLLTEPNATVSCQVRMSHVDGSWRWIDVTFTNLLHDPSVRGIVTNGRDMTEARRFQDQLSYQASHDELTGLANRALFTKRMARAVSASSGPGTVAVALVDLDDFKAINDRLGHTVGDALLIAVAARLRGCLRPGDAVARLGGDEFAVLLGDLRPGESSQVAERIIFALAAPVRAAGHDLLAQASIGIADNESDLGAAELLRRADVAMYSAKELGKSRYAHYNADLDARAVEHARLAAELRQALDRNEFSLMYQPIVALPDGDITGVEALVRWNHPERGFVSPADFIPVAERTGLIVPLGAWVMETACRQAAAWLDEYGERAPARMAVNVSARQLLEPTFPQVVAGVLAGTGLPAQMLTIEITETAVFGGGPAVDAVTAVHALGVDIALDDFGTGHSSLGLLRTCPVDVIKVDKSFVDGVTGTVEQEAIATSIGQIAHALGLRAVAEGVETAAQAERLHVLGYRLAQGFHFARPMRADDLARQLAPVPLPDPA